MSASQKEIFWQQHIQAWQRGSLSQTEYCRQHELSLATFGYWRRRLKSNAVPTVIPVTREMAVTGLQLRSPKGWQVELPANLSLESLRTLLSLLS
ncbi:MAG TPA: IS66 family insertion sequence element accessory protein TnpB [Gammaproteobacteria bacterium]|nr:IS66 family insertion sequence element accessory protein TnpB [Gammaproteobacteria bacterium]